MSADVIGEYVPRAEYLEPLERVWRYTSFAVPGQRFQNLMRVGRH